MRKSSNVDINRVAHVKKRALQRFNLKLTTRDILKISKMIRNGQSQYIGAESNKRTVHVIEYKGEEMVVVYHKDSKIPITILPREDSHYAYKEE